MMDTPITIPSTISNCSDALPLTCSSDHQDEKIVSLGSSSSFNRVPVSWTKTHVPFSRTDSNITLSNIQKVNNWIRSIEGGSLHTTDDLGKDDVLNILSSSESMETRKSSDSESNSVILVRCDFKKKVPSANFTTDYTHSSLINFLKNDAHNHHVATNNFQFSNPCRKNLLLKRPGKNKIYTFNKQIDEKFSIDKDSFQSLKPSDLKSDSGSDFGEIPLSSESRKKELCSYLQLMNPADKKEIFIFQNRRSTRVKNLAALQEKKELEKRIMQGTGKEDKCVTLKSFKELNMQIEDCDDAQDNTICEQDKNSFNFPFPPKALTEEISDFDLIMSKLVPRLKRRCQIKNLKLQCTNKLKNRQQLLKMKIRKSKAKVTQTNSLNKVSNINNKFNGIKNQKFNLKKLRQNGLRNINKKIKSERRNSLRSNGQLKNVPLKKIIGKKERELKHWKNYKKRQLRTNQQKSIKSDTFSKTSNSKSVTPLCEIVTVASSTEEDLVDLENFMDDMIDFKNLSEEHKKCLIQSRIFSIKPMKLPLEDTKDTQSLPCSENLSPLYGFSEADFIGASKLCETYINTIIPSREKVFKPQIFTPKVIEKSNHGSVAGNSDANDIPLQEHDYAGSQDTNIINDESMDVDVITVPCKNLPVRVFEVDTKTIVKQNKYELLPYDKTIDVKSLHKSLEIDKRKTKVTMDPSLGHEWDSDGSPKQKAKKQSHFINIDRGNGSILKAFYIDFNLILCQEYAISFWMQTPLGNVLGSQNMWIPRGLTQRLVLNNKCVQKESAEMVICTETNIAYVELWTKEHKSDIRQGPVADVFATLYFWKQRQNGLDKKVLQLENINGFADDVQYSVMKCLSKIIVSWHSANENNVSKSTFIHAYQLAPDYQTVSNIYDIEPVGHYVSSLHNIEDCENLIMGCGENKITLWNVEYGYIIATIELMEIKSPLCTLWVKCDRGFLFALQQCVDRELRLIAINGINHSWKKLASYFPPESFDRLRGVCVKNGLIVSFYDQGILCWRAETGEPVEEILLETDVILSGEHVILLENDRVIVKHAMTYVMSFSTEDS